MKLIIKKETNDNISMKINIEGQPEKDFDYIDFIEGIYNKDEISDIDFDDSINEWEKDSISKLINKINELVRIYEEPSADNYDEETEDVDF